MTKTSRPGIYSRLSRGKTVYDATASYNGRQRMKRGFRTMALAREWQEGEVARMRGKLVGLASSRLTLHSFIYDTWWPEHKGSIKASETIRSYESYLRRLDEFMGKEKLAELTRASVSGLKGKMTRAKLGTAMASQVYTMLRMVLGYAVAEGYIVVDPSYKVQRPAYAQERPTLSTATILTVRDAAIATDYAEFIQFDISTGLRWKEITHLEWSDVDFGAAEVQVRRETTKSDAGVRTIALAPDTLAMLQTYRHEQMRAFNEKKVALPRLVFTTKRGNRLNSGNFHASFWRGFRESLGLPDLHFHDLRHAQSTLSARAGVDPAVTQRRLGHSDIKMTLGTYAHVGREDQVAAALAVEQYLNMAAYQRLSKKAVEGES